MEGRGGGRSAAEEKKNGSTFTVCAHRTNAKADMKRGKRERGHKKKKQVHACCRSRPKGPFPAPPPLLRREEADPIVPVPMDPDGGTTAPSLSLEGVENAVQGACIAPAGDGLPPPPLPNDGRHLPPVAADDAAVAEEEGAPPRPKEDAENTARGGRTGVRGGGLGSLLGSLCGWC